MAKNGDKNPPKKPGRKRIDLDMAEVERLASRGLGPTQIARSLGVSWSTIDRNRKRSAEFDEVIKKGKARGISMVTDALMQSATEGNVTAQIFYLKNRDSEHWKDRTDVNVATKVSISDALDAARGRALTQAQHGAPVIDHDMTKLADNSDLDEDIDG